MTAFACTAPLPLAALVDYDAGDLPDLEAARVEEHFFACAACTERLAAIRRLGAGIAGLVRSGGVTASVTSELVERARAHGLVLRSYRVAPGETVACTASPDDDFVVIRLGVDTTPDETVDLETTITLVESGGTDRIVSRDVTVDRERREIVILNAGDRVRAMPRSRWSIEARVAGPGGERRLGPYVLDHAPWREHAG